MSVSLPIELDREDDGRWIAEIRDLPGTLCCGKNRDEAIWRANVRREVSTDGGSTSLWSKENQLRKLGGRQPGETAPIASATEGQAPVTVKALPAHIGHLEGFAAHGLDRVPEERLHFTNLDTHV